MADFASAGSPVRYIAQIAPAREVTLLGTADMAFWSERLREAGLHPTRVDGKAEVVLSAVGARYKGIGFREFSVSAFVCRREGGPDRDAVYLAGAFNTSRFFAFVERTVFRTPYLHGSVSVDPGPPASFGVAGAGGAWLRARMAPGGTPEARVPVRAAEEGWEGPLFLPGPAPGRYFFARVAGFTRAYPFDPSADEVALNPPPGDEALRWLADSRFSGREWIVRESATHARSGTFRRGRGSPFP